MDSRARCLTVVVQRGGVGDVQRRCGAGAHFHDYRQCDQLTGVHRADIEGYRAAIHCIGTLLCAGRYIRQRRIDWVSDGHILE